MRTLLAWGLFIVGVIHIFVWLFSQDIANLIWGVSFFTWSDLVEIKDRLKNV